MYMLLCLCVAMGIVNEDTSRPEEDVGSPGHRITGAYDL